ncbi:hypothetical protein FJZ31_26015 [Candidatus Poribacteria bacterium]|nr:hypothetical protein [Candidatus Poribacteria bacterium]
MKFIEKYSRRSFIIRDDTKQADARHFFFVIMYMSAILFSVWTNEAMAGVWQDDFEGPALGDFWRGDIDNFSLQDGKLQGRSAHPILVFPRFIEIGNDWTDYTVQCQVNVIEPNLLECSKGAFLLRYKEKEGYVFALHVATESVEVYRFSGERLLSVQMPLQLKTWYTLRTEVQGNNFIFYVDNKHIGTLQDHLSSKGSVGLLVEDALSVLFDNFWVSGPDIPSGGHGTASIKSWGKKAIVWAELKARSQ